MSYAHTIRVVPFPERDPFNDDLADVVYPWEQDELRSLRPADDEGEWSEPEPREPETPVRAAGPGKVVPFPERKPFNDDLRDVAYPWEQDELRKLDEEVERREPEPPEGNE